MTDRMVSHENNFRIVRHIAATAVIFSHAFIVNGGLSNLSFEPLEAATGVSFAELAVNIFFITSGFLVTQSILSRGSLVTYFISRALRIYPALITVVCVTALVLGPLVTVLSVGEYFTSKSAYAYIVYDAVALNPFRMRFELPGVFGENPYPNVVNASLWTLPWEIWMYILLSGLLAARLLRGVGLAVVWVVLMAGHTAVAFEIVEFGLWGEIASRFMAYFFTGALFYRYRDWIVLTPWRQALVTLVFATVTLFVQNTVLLPIFVAHTTLFLALYPPLVVKSLSEGADISYGIYLYAYPIQQLLVMGLGPHGPYLNTLLAFLLTVPMAALSWYLVEKPALGLKFVLMARADAVIGRLAEWRSSGRGHP